MVASKKSSTQRYNEKYRRKIHLKRLQSKVFNAKVKADQNSRQRKCRQRRKEAQRETASATVPPSANIDLRTVEGAKRRRANTKKLRDENEKLLEEIQRLKNENAEMKKILSEQRSGTTNTVDTTPALSPTKLFIDNVSPAAKKRAKRRLLDEKENLPRGSISKLRKRTGINLSSDYIPSSSTPSTLQKEIEEFLCQDDVSKQAPDKKKQLHGKQIRYLLNHLSTLHQRFVTETGNTCHYSTFTRYVPEYVMKPKGSDWGTCLCVICLNPQMKFEKLVNLKGRYSIIKSILIEDVTDITELVTDEIRTNDFKHDLARLNSEQFTITYSEWTKRKNEGSHMFISTKTTLTYPIRDFVDKFTVEIEELAKHIDRVRQQFRAAKKARAVALEEDNVATIQLDWSENYNLKQARQEKASYYYEQHISILSGYVWMRDGCYSFGSVSDDTNHMFEAAWTGLQPIFDDLKNHLPRITTIIFISDSPVSQFRNKTTFFFLKQYAVTNQITMKWIYLETGHGKGVADAAGATVKRLMDQAVAFHPDDSYENAADLINEVKKNTDIKLFTYSREEIDSQKKNIPSLTAIKGTASLHEVIVKPDGAVYGKDTSFGAERLLKLNF